MQNLGYLAEFRSEAIRYQNEFMSTRPDVIRLLLVEDDLDVAAGIGDYLGAHHVVVDFACNAATAMALVREHAFDLVVLDVQLPDRDGLQLCKELKHAGLVAPVLFLTARGGLDDKLRAFAVGAVDYMVKPFAPAELLARVRALVSHIPAAGGLRLRAGDYQLDLQTRLLTRGEVHLVLHQTHFVIMRRLLQAFPGSVSRDQLCELLWSGETPDSDPLRMHVYELRRALREAFGDMPVHTVRGVGYRFGGSDGAT